ncbi:unnamed protein product [Ixodes persulcatus]
MSAEEKLYFNLFLCVLCLWGRHHSCPINFWASASFFSFTYVRSFFECYSPYTDLQVLSPFCARKGAIYDMLKLEKGGGGGGQQTHSLHGEYTDACNMRLKSLGVNLKRYVTRKSKQIQKRKKKNLHQ